MRRFHCKVSLFQVLVPHVLSVLVLHACSGKLKESIIITLLKEGIHFYSKFMGFGHYLFEFVEVCKQCHDNFIVLLARKTRLSHFYVELNWIENMSLKWWWINATLANNSQIRQHQLSPFINKLKIHRLYSADPTCSRMQDACHWWT